MPQVNSRNSTNSRGCGDCHACCESLAIDAGNVGPGAKPPGVTCPNCRGTGCRIYQQRPQVCADFACRWLTETHWPDEWRPDLSGLLCLKKKAEGGVAAAMIIEIRQDAWTQPTAALILAEVKRTTAVLVAVDSQFQRTPMWGDLAIHTEHATPSPYHSQSMTPGWQERVESEFPAVYASEMAG